MWAAANSPKPVPKKKVIVKRIRLIEAAPDSFEESEVFSSTALPFEKRTVEAVGEHYERLLERIYGEEVKEETVPEDESLTSPEESEQSAKYTAHKKTKGKPSADLYELLGLGHLRWQATHEEIKLAYRKVAKECHPDKSDSHDDTMFKAVGSAFDTLSDPRKRRDYDSADPFDDALPTADSITCEADFYKIYGAVFRNNAKWSKKTPVPDLGDANTPYSQLEVFYTFWIRFQTWREFAYLNEYEPEQAESREEKRWMERQNAKLQEHKRKEEAARLTRLVDQAYARDPRILARKAELLAEKGRRKQEKQDAQRKIKEEQARQQAEIEAEKARQIETARVAAAAAKVEREKIKKAMRKKRQLLRQFGDANGIHFEQIEKLCEALNLDRLEFILLAPSDIETTKKKILVELDSFKTDAERKREEEERARVERAAEAKKAEEAKEVKWTAEELSLLTKALARFPGGTNNRWGQIAAYLNHTKTEADIIAKIKSVKTKDLKEKPATRELEDSFKKFLRDKKDATVISAHSVRYEGSDVAPTASLSASAMSPSSTSLANVSAATSNASPSNPAATAAAATASESSSSNASANGACTSQAETPAAAPAAATTAASTATPTATLTAAPTAAPTVAPTAAPTAAPTTTPTAAPAARDWTPEEQSALEIALKKYPATIKENRWELIAAAVPGRSKKECVDRFKYLVSIVKGTKK